MPPSYPKAKSGEAGYTTSAPANGRAYSRYIYYETQLENEFAAMRYGVADGKIEKIVSLKGIRRLVGALGHWSGLDPTDAPVLLRNTGNQQIYVLDWDAP